MERLENFVALTQSSILNGRINVKGDLMDFRNSELFEELLNKAGYHTNFDCAVVRELLMSLETRRDDYEIGYDDALLKELLYDELFDYVLKKICHWYYHETKSYRVVAHCADGDVEIKPKGKDTFSILNDAVEARNGLLVFCDDIDIVELTNC